MKSNTTEQNELHDDILLVLDEKPGWFMVCECGIGGYVYISSSSGGVVMDPWLFVTSSRSFRRRFLVRCHILR